jgi:hypothetical protein
MKAWEEENGLGGVEEGRVRFIEKYEDRNREVARSSAWLPCKKKQRIISFDKVFTRVSIQRLLP